jgi:hypothetical protein
LVDLAHAVLDDHGMGLETLSRAAALRAWACNQGFGSSERRSAQTIVDTETYRWSIRETKLVGGLAG